MSKVCDFQNFLQVKLQSSSRVIEVEVGNDLWVNKSYLANNHAINQHVTTESWEVTWICVRKKGRLVMNSKVASLKNIHTNTFSSECSGNTI